jgi:hypothetical protein
MRPIGTEHPLKKDKGTAQDLREGPPAYLKVPKCENFHHTDFFYFYTIKPPWVGDFRAKIKN